MLSHDSHVCLFVTLWTVAHQAPLSMGFSRQEYWSGLPCPATGDLPDLGTEPTSLVSLALAGGFFITISTWEESHTLLKPLRWFSWWLSWSRIHLQCGRPSWIPGLGRSPGGGHATHSSTLAWRIPLDRGPWGGGGVCGVAKRVTKPSPALHSVTLGAVRLSSCPITPAPPAPIPPRHTLPIFHNVIE